jgi:uncharacterized protein (DUF4415 family)
MAKKSTGSSVLGARAKKRGKRLSDNKLDFSDIPEQTAEELKQFRKVGRPIIGGGLRQMIAIRMDPVTLKKLRLLADKAGKGYQTLINEILADYLKKRPA